MSKGAMTDILHEWWEVRGERQKGLMVTALLGADLVYRWSDLESPIRFTTRAEARRCRDELDHPDVVGKVVHVVRRKRGEARREARDAACAAWRAFSSNPKAAKYTDLVRLADEMLAAIDRLAKEPSR